MWIIILMPFLVALIMAVMYTTKVQQAAKEVPRYGGAPVIINHMLMMAKHDEDDETQIEARQLRKSLFRERRSPEEQRTVERNARARYLEKYGQRGEIALAKTDQRLHFQSLSPEDKQKALEIALEEAKKKKLEALKEGGP